VCESGNISFISQSGAIGVYGLEFAAQNDISFAKFISLGNKAHINENDVLHALAKDEKTRVILAYLENLDNPRRFIDISDKITRGDNAQPVLVIKSGRSESGKRAVDSHTGALSQRDDVLDFLFDQCGVIRVDSMEKLFYHALCFSNQPIPAGAKMAILTNAGGPSIVATDEAENSGIEIPQLSSQCQDQLKSHLPDTVSVTNPIDLVGDADEERFRTTLEVIVQCNEIDMVLVICTPQMVTDLEKIATTVASFADEARKKGKTLVTSFAAFDRETMVKVQNILAKEDIPNYRFVGNGVNACASMVRFARLRSRPESKAPQYEVEKDVVRRILEQSQKKKENNIKAPESYRILDAYGFSVAQYDFVTNKQQAREAGRKIGYPLAASVVSSEITHKSGKGGVILNIRNDKELDRSYEQIMRNVGTNEPEANISGILLQEMMTEGAEMILGAQFNEQYGHLLMFGLGGIYVEILKDVAFRLVPINRYDAEEMIKGTKAYEILTGFRGKPPANIDRLSDSLLRLSQLVKDFPGIKEIDLNPVFATKKDAKVADVRIILQ